MWTVFSLDASQRSGPLVWGALASEAAVVAAVVAAAVAAAVVAAVARAFRHRHGHDERSQAGGHRSHQSHRQGWEGDFTYGTGIW